jgi:hypothetical protein
MKKETIKQGEKRSPAHHRRAQLFDRLWNTIFPLVELEQQHLPTSEIHRLAEKSVYGLMDEVETIYKPHGNLVE